jgi:ABC-type multidrug transport system permease subunit
MRGILFLAWNDAKLQLRQGSTLLWVLVMPPIFFYFIGTVTGGMSSGFGGGEATPITVVAESPGFLEEQLSLRLRGNDFEPTWVSDVTVGDGGAPPRRTLTIGPDLSSEIRAGNPVTFSFDTKASSLSRDFEIIRVQRSLYTALADIVVADAIDASGVSAAGLISLNAEPRIWQLDVSPAGERLEIPSGFQQTIPGILVMFTLLVLLTSGAPLLVTERRQGLLRRLASAPMSRSEVVAGKWGGRMILATIQVGAALGIGTWLFKMQWGPDLWMVLVILAAWAGFCATAGLLVGSIATTEAQAGGLGVLVANTLAALGGCWWPIEVTPRWMQILQNFTPTGWTMDAMHKLISFQSGAASAVPQLAIIVAATLLMAAFAVNRFQYQ